MAHPHDHLFQLAFADPVHAAPLLRSALAPAVVAEIDWQTLVRLSPAHRGRRGRRTVCDVLFSVRTHRDAEVLLYVVLEHKSKATRFDALQMIEQVVAVLRTHRREHARSRYLPLVLPLIVHAGKRPSTAPTQLSALFDLSRLPVELHRCVSSFEFALDDLSGKPPEHLRRRALTIFGLCVLSTLQYLPPAARDADAFGAWLDEFRDVQERAARLAESGADREIYEAVVDYILETSDLPHAVVHRVLHSRWTSDTMKKFVSTRTQIRNEGRVEGKVEGKAEGAAEGRVALLLRQLTRRFGADAAREAAPRLRACSVDELDRLGDRLLDVASFDELFAD